jgi:hypothetical protein
MRPPEKIREVSNKTVTVAAKRVLVLINEPITLPTAAARSKASTMKMGVNKTKGGPLAYLKTINENKNEGMNALRNPYGAACLFVGNQETNDNTGEASPKHYYCRRIQRAWGIEKWREKIIKRQSKKQKQSLHSHAYGQHKFSVSA